MLATDTKRMARCECGRTVPSDEPLSGFKSLPFFENRGPGSPFATELCKCGRLEFTHKDVDGRPRLSCESFEPRGPHEFDSFYCGCRGWD